MLEDVQEAPRVPRCDANVVLMGAMALVLGCNAPGTAPGGEPGTSSDDDTGSGPTGETTTETVTGDGDSTGSGGRTGGDGPTGTSTGTEDTGCRSHDECSAPTPYCELLRCVTCQDFKISVCPYSQPVCAESGVCVECTEQDQEACELATPVCDDQACRGCLDHGECELGCNFLSGACLRGYAVSYVDQDRCQPDAEGTEEDPFCTIGQATSKGGRRDIIVTGGGSYVESLSISGDDEISIVARDGPTLTASGGSALEVSDGAEVYLSGLTLENTESASVVDCNNAEVALHDVTIEGSQSNAVDGYECEVGLHSSQIRDNALRGVLVGGGTLRVVGNTISGSGSEGIYASGATVEVSRSAIVGSQGTGIMLLDDSDLTSTNVIVGNNGSGQGDWQIEAGTDGNVDLLYTTVVGIGATRVLHCDDNHQMARNSIFVTESTEALDCPGIDVSFSIVQPDELAGNSNKVAEKWSESWFVDPKAGDFHLADGGVESFKGVAVLGADDPETDIDGDPRPTVDLASDWPGADRPAP